VNVALADVSALGTELLTYGIRQKLRDAASAASTQAKETNTEVAVVAQGMLDAAYKSLTSGEWSHRGDGSGVDPRTAIARSIVRKAIKEKVGSKSPQWATFTGLSDSDQLAKLDETYTSNSDVFDPAIDADYFAFSDQDDVWYLDKLRRALTWLVAVPGNIPALYCGRTELMSIDGQSYGFSPLFTRPPTFRNALVQNLGGVCFRDTGARHVHVAVYFREHSLWRPVGI